MDLKWIPIKFFFTKSCGGQIGWIDFGSQLVATKRRERERERERELELVEHFVGDFKQTLVD